MRTFLVACVVVCIGAAIRATSFVPVTFSDLIARADVIFVGDVVDVRPFTVQTRDGTVIKTRVIFRVDDALFGTASAVEVFDFLGGEVDGVGMRVAEMPTFHVGDRRVVFARRERSINPIVGFTQGLLDVQRDAGGIDRVFTIGGLPLDRPESVGRAVQPRGAGPLVPMRLSDLRARILSAVNATRR